MRAIAASPRATVCSIGLSEEGREAILMAIADSATIANLETYRGYLHELTDARVTSEQRAQALIDGVSKPIYWLISGMHSPENGGPEMLQEVAYRLVVLESDFVRSIRDEVITFITPVIEVDGRERQVDTYYFNKDRPDDEGALPLMHWGKYVAHGNNGDAMGQMLQLTKHVNRVQLEWAPTILQARRYDRPPGEAARLSGRAPMVGGRAGCAARRLGPSRTTSSWSRPTRPCRRCRPRPAPPAPLRGYGAALERPTP